MEPTSTGAAAGAVAIYLIYWFAVAWFSGYARHLRETVALVKRRLDPEMPSGVHLHLPQPWFVRYGALENLLVLLGLAYGMTLLRWPWILGGFAVFLFVFLPLCERLLTPYPGTWHYLRKVRRLLQMYKAQSEQEGRRERAELYRIALDRVDKGL